MKIDYQEKLIELFVLAATAPHKKGFEKCIDLISTCNEFLTNEEIATATIKAEYILQTLKKLEVSK